jgi:tRNA uridine 5-carbamoylmethylation protein Kti12
MNDTKMIIMLVGVPAAGKSTWRRLFMSMVDHHNYSIISTDDYIDAVAAQQNKTYSEVFVNEIKNAELAMNIAFKANLDYNRSIIVDRTNTTIKSRARFLSQVPSNYKKIAVFFPTPANLLERLNSRPGKVIPPDVMENMMKGLEYPKYSEGFDMIYEYKGQ